MGEAYCAATAARDFTLVGENVWKRRHKACLWTESDMRNCVGSMQWRRRREKCGAAKSRSDSAQNGFVPNVLVNLKNEHCEQCGCEIHKSRECMEGKKAEDQGERDSQWHPPGEGDSWSHSILMK